MDYDHAELILRPTVAHVAAGGARGAVMLGDVRYDHEASRKMALVIAGKGRAAGMERTAERFRPPT
jgi:citrate lyase subunit beta/citryl-CoA lyase